MFPLWSRRNKGRSHHLVRAQAGAAVRGGQRRRRLLAEQGNSDHLPGGGGSLESEVCPKLAQAGRLLGSAYQGYFVDIGVPDDYDTACRELTTALGCPAVSSIETMC